jgi:Zn-dependent peptidase ImmA (M78 family)
MSLTLENAADAQYNFEALRAGNFVERIRPYDDHPIADIDTILTKTLGGRIMYGSLGGDNGRLVLLDPLVISINKNDSQCTQIITKGHEVGHYFLQAIAEPWLRASWGRVDRYCALGTPGHEAIEAFCDYFAHRLIGTPPCLAGLEGV